MSKKPRIEVLPAKKFVGKRVVMSFSRNKTFGLWRKFMPHREKIENKAGNHLWSIEFYEPGFFENYNPHTKFEKWAAVEVEDFGHLPDGFETLSVAEGLYAGFIHKGPASEASKTYQYIFGKWLPKSDYELDDRPHFAVMGEKYKNEHPDSEEELWIPVKSGKE